MFRFVLISVSMVFSLKEQEDKNPPKDPQQNSHQNAGASQPKSTLQGYGLEQSCFSRIHIPRDPQKGDLREGVYRHDRDAMIPWKCTVDGREGDKGSGSGSSPPSRLYKECARKKKKKTSDEATNLSQELITFIHFTFIHFTSSLHHFVVANPLEEENSFGCSWIASSTKTLHT